MSALRILHTSDWHLGKRLFKTERYEEHEKFLDWLYKEIQFREINLLIIAGDVFDVPSAPNQAQKIFYDFIYKISLIKDLKTVVIGGNHDSNSLLTIPQSFFKDKDCIIQAGLCDNNLDHNHIIEHAGVKIGIKTLPYFRNFELINKIGNIEEGCEDQIENYFRGFFQEWPNENLDHKILVSHHGFGQYTMAGSEHAIYLSGLEYFPLEWVISYFDYVALGHIHKKLTLNESPPIIYPGSPIPMRFSESNKKYVSFVECHKNSIKQEFIPIPHFRSLFQIKVNPENFKEKIKHQLAKRKKNELKSYVEVHMELKEPMAGLADKIRELLTKKDAQLLSYIPIIDQQSDEKEKSQNITNLSLEELFKQYYQKRYESEEIPSEILKSFNQIIEEIRHEDS